MEGILSPLNLGFWYWNDLGAGATVATVAVRDMLSGRQED